MADALQDSKNARVSEIIDQVVELAEETQRTVSELLTVLRQYAESQEDAQ